MRWPFLILLSAVATAAMFALLESEVSAIPPYCNSYCSCSNSCSAVCTHPISEEYITCGQYTSYCDTGEALSVSLYCSGGTSERCCWANAGGGSGGYSYSWQYAGPGSFSSSGNLGCATFSPPCDNAQNSFFVTVTDRCGNQAYTSQGYYCP